MKILLIFSAISLIYSMDQNELMSAKKSKVNGNNDDNLLIRSPIIDLGNDWYQESIVKDPEYHDKLNVSFKK